MSTNKLMAQPSHNISERYDQHRNTDHTLKLSYIKLFLDEKALHIRQAKVVTHTKKCVILKFLSPVTV